MEDKTRRDGDPLEEIDPGMLQLSSAVRRIINATRLADPPPGLAGEIAVHLDQLAGRLEPYAHLGTIAQGSLRNDSNPVEKRFGSPADFFPTVRRSVLSTPLLRRWTPSWSTGNHSGRFVLPASLRPPMWDPPTSSRVG